jgi:hypothetical protein
MSREFRPIGSSPGPYLWAWQQECGETKGGTPIDLGCGRCAHEPPQADRIALEVSDIECRPAGLTDLKRCWIIVDQYNCDVAEHSWYIEPDAKALGRFSDAFMMRIAAPFAGASRRSGRHFIRTE